MKVAVDAFKSPGSALYLVREGVDGGIIFLHLGNGGSHFRRSYQILPYQHTAYDEADNDEHN